MSNYAPTGNPVQITRGSSSIIRAEFVAISTAVNSKSDTAGQSYSGTHDFSAGLLRSATPVSGQDVTTKSYVDNLAFSAALPVAPGTAVRYYIGTINGVNSWDVPRMQTSARSSNTILGTTDSGTIIDANGTFTQTFSAPGTLGAGWNCIYRNVGTGDIEVEAPEAVATTSATSNSISAGTVWTVPAGLAISAGDLVIVRRTADPFNQRIVGTVASYTGTTLTITPTYRIGSGTFTDWSISTRAATAGIDSRASYVMYPGEARLFQCDGTRIESVVLSRYSLKKTVTQYVVKPPGYNDHFVRLMGAGAGGGGGSGGASGQGSSGATGGGGGAGGASGGQGQVVEKTIMDSVLGEAILFTSGAGSIGAAGSAGGAGTSNASGNPSSAASSSGVGGASSFGQVGDSGYLTAAGGAIGVGGGSAQAGPGGTAAIGSAATTGFNSYNAIKVCNTLAANSSTAGTSSASTTGKAGSVGANGTGALGTPTTTTTGGTAGATQVTTGIVGNAGGDATGTAAPGQGGAGGGGGGGSATSVAVSANGGAGGRGADGGPGQLEMTGM